MKLAPEDINACRALVQWILRSLAVLCMSAGVLLGGAHLLEALFRRGLYLGAFDTDLALLITGAALAFGARPISKWIVVLPATGCPRCGHYRPPGGQDTRCAECGLDWSRK